MNALRPMITRNMARATQTVQYRAKATTAQDIIKRNNQFKKSWLSDPSTYPIMVIMGGGICWMVGMGLNALTYKDVQISPNSRGAKLKDRSREHRVGILETFVNLKGGVKAEGLGINHEEWAKQKEEYKKN